MSRLLPIVLLASLVAGFAGAPVSHADDSEPVVLVSQAGGHSGAPMTAMDCGACSAMGACIASPSPQNGGLDGSPLPPWQPFSEILDRVRAPDTAPPKSSSV